MFKTIAAGATLAFTIVAAQPAAAAVAFSGNYQVTQLNSTGPGLQVSVAPNPGALSFTMADGPSVLNDQQLFKLWTSESAVNADDYNGSTITVKFNFTAPAAGTGEIGGVTYGETSLFGFFQNGAVQWSGVATIDFGQYGVLTIKLDDAVFNEGAWWSLNNGQQQGSFITADFSLAPAVTSAVPEPATWAMMIAGFGLAGAAIRRRNGLAAVA